LEFLCSRIPRLFAARQIKILPILVAVVGRLQSFLLRGCTKDSQFELLYSKIFRCTAEQNTVNLVAFVGKLQKFSRAAGQKTVNLSCF
jgi:hypothetical protein